MKCTVQTVHKRRTLKNIVISAVSCAAYITDEFHCSTAVAVHGYLYEMFVLH